MYLAHRIREAWVDDQAQFSGLVEVDEIFVGGREANKRGNKKLKAGRGTVGKTAVVGVRGRETGTVRAPVASDTRTETLQGFVAEYAAPDAEFYYNDATAYRDLPFHHASV